MALLLEIAIPAPAREGGGVLRGASAAGPAANPLRNQVHALIGAPSPVAPSPVDIVSIGRFQALAELGGALTPEEVAALCTFLESTAPVPDLGPAELAWLKNDLMNRLALQPDALPRLAACLLRMRADKEQPPVMRNYALQHLSANAVALGRDNPAMTPILVGVFQSAIDDASGVTGATALLALDRLDREGGLSDADRNALLVQARLLAGSCLIEPSVRASALGVLLERSDPEVGDYALRILLEEDEWGPVPEVLRLSANAVLSAQGYVDEELRLP